MWEYDREPTRQERQVAAPELPRHRSRKDRRRWCGGHVGREHEPVVRESKWATWRRDRGVSTDHTGCRWAPRYRWLRADERIHADAQLRPGGRYMVIDRYVWNCDHELGCDRCGKVLESTLGRKCPDFHERTA